MSAAGSSWRAWADDAGTDPRHLAWEREQLRLYDTPALDAVWELAVAIHHAGLELDHQWGRPAAGGSHRPPVDEVSDRRQVRYWHDRVVTAATAADRHISELGGDPASDRVQGLFHEAMDDLQRGRGQPLARHAQLMAAVLGESYASADVVANQVHEELAAAADRTAQDLALQAVQPGPGAVADQLAALHHRTALQTHLDQHPYLRRPAGADRALTVVPAATGAAQATARARAALTPPGSGAAPPDLKLLPSGPTGARPPQESIASVAARAAQPAPATRGRHR